MAWSTSYELSDEEMEEGCSIFLVWKSSRDELRVIIDCRRGNSRLVDPPSTDLSEGGAMSDVWVDAEPFLIEGAAAEATPRTEETKTMMSPLSLARRQI